MKRTAQVQIERQRSINILLTLSQAGVADAAASYPLPTPASRKAFRPLWSAIAFSFLSVNPTSTHGYPHLIVIGLVPMLTNRAHFLPAGPVARPARR